MNEGTVVKWGPEGKGGTNGSLMKISSLLVNAGRYTHHANGQQRKIRLAHTTDLQKAGGFVTSPSRDALFLHSSLSILSKQMVDYHHHVLSVTIHVNYDWLFSCFSFFSI